VERKARVTTCLILGVLAAGLLAAQSEFAGPKTMARNGTQKFTAARTTLPAAAKPAPKLEAGKVIMVLQTRDHRITVRSSSTEESRYSVETLHGIALAEGLSVAELMDRFPALHDIVTGTAWAGIDVPRK
jgi:hypothetical protein